MSCHRPNVRFQYDNGMNGTCSINNSFAALITSKWSRYAFPRRIYRVRTIHQRRWKQPLLHGKRLVNVCTHMYAYVQCMPYSLYTRISRFMRPNENWRIERETKVGRIPTYSIYETLVHSLTVTFFASASGLAFGMRMNIGRSREWKVLIFAVVVRCRWWLDRRLTTH